MAFLKRKFPTVGIRSSPLGRIVRKRTLLNSAGMWSRRLSRFAAVRSVEKRLCAVLVSARSFICSSTASTSSAVQDSTSAVVESRTWSTWDATCSLVNADLRDLRCCWWAVP